MQYDEIEYTWAYDLEGKITPTSRKRLTTSRRDLLHVMQGTANRDGELKLFVLKQIGQGSLDISRVPDSRPIWRFVIKCLQYVIDKAAKPLSPVFQEILSLKQQELKQYVPRKAFVALHARLKREEWFRMKAEDAAKRPSNLEKHLYVCFTHVCGLMLYYSHACSIILSYLEQIVNPFYNNVFLNIDAQLEKYVIQSLSASKIQKVTAA